jgi:chemotaxis protein MotC
LQIARRAVIDGKMDAARFAAAKATGLSGEGTIERARSMLYEAAALILTDQFQPGLAKLESIDQGALPKHDYELREAIAAVAARIGELPRKVGANDAGEPETRRSTLPAAANASASASALIGLVEQRLSLADEVLERSRP